MSEYIYSTEDIIAIDKDHVVNLHNAARILEQADSTLGLEVRKAADRLNELAKAAHNRKHWTGHE
jgi:hypothetical protein